ncbi:MAG: YHYH protein [Pseudomonadota bacterium]
MKQKLLRTGIAATLSVGALATLAYGAGSAQITISANQTCIASDGLPNHQTGNFPNRGNPHRMRAQRISVCVPANPVKNNRPTQIDRGAIGIALNGVMFRPEAADYWDPNARRGFSRRDTGWRLEPMGPRNLFGLDMNNAHVDRRGLYHYHGKPTGLLASTGGTHVGYAADGFEIHYVGSSAKSGWSLKSGNRPSAPGGQHDGTYIQDYEYTGGSGRLDQCNGAMMGGRYVYFVTDTFPFYPRCLWGNVAGGFR